MGNTIGLIDKGAMATPKSMGLRKGMMLYPPAMPLVLGEELPTPREMLYPTGQAVVESPGPHTQHQLSRTADRPLQPDHRHLDLQERGAMSSVA